MIDIRPDLEQEYNFWLQQIGEDPYKDTCIVGIHDVLRAHFLLVDYFFIDGQDMGGIGPRDLDLLHSAIDRQVAGFGGQRKWKDPIDICSTLFYGLIKNHPFHDCNKRTALLTALFYLHKIKRTPDTSQSLFEDLTIKVADSSLQQYNFSEKFRKLDDRDIHVISHFFRRNTRTIDKKNYVITNKQLDKILSKYNFFLDNPNGSYIDIMIKEEINVGLLRRKEIRTKRLGQIGFQGWNAEVSQLAIRKVRLLTKLRDEDGIDSSVFFHGEDSMSALINTYREPLRRLAKK